MRRWAIVASCMTAWAWITVSPAAQTRTPEELTRLFADDPPKALAEGARMFQEAAAKGDLEAMMSVIGPVAQNATRTLYYSLAEDMIDAAAQTAERQGAWAVLGDIWTTRASLMWEQKEAAIGAPDVATRSAYFASLADAAYARAGTASPEYLKLRSQLRDYEPELMKQQADTANWQRRFLGPAYYPMAEAASMAIAEGRDADATAIMQRMAVAASGDLRSEEARNALGYVATRLWLRGSEPLLPALRDAIEREGGGSDARSIGLLGSMLRTCSYAWGGQDDIYHDTMRWSFGRLYVVPGLAGGHDGLPFIQKLNRWGRLDEANLLSGAWVESLCRLGQGDPYGVWTINRATPAELRRTIVFQTLQWLAEHPANVHRGDATILLTVPGAAPEGQKGIWASETGMQVLEVAPMFPDSRSRALVVSGAAELFHQAGRDDLAGQAVALSEGLAGRDPATVLRCALNTGWYAYQEHRWDGVIGALRRVVGGQPPSADVVEAYLLLGKANAELGKSGDAEDCLDRGAEAAGQCALPPGELADFLMRIASLTQDQARKVSLLQQAQQASEAAGLPLMTEKAAARLAASALEGGNLAAAEQALIAVIDRGEQKRESLAFDPVLRQQWFADNITPYRQLLRLAALKEDPYLALSCAERMRSRVLLDQLAWRKVDMGLRLPPDVQERLQSLRQMREDTYALLSTVVPSGASGSGEGERGVYMPIRGLLDEGKPATTADVTRLKEQLASLAQAEAAMESVIRERIPAYAMASSAPIPSGQELVEAMRGHPEVAVLEYTFSDEGIVVVALRGDAPPKVASIGKRERDTLWEQIGRFRESIWERKDEAKKQAANLYKVLVWPVADMLSGAQRVWVVAEGAIQLVPFAALVDENGSYLGERVAVAYAPSLSLALSSRGHRPKSAREAVILAAPDTGALDVGDADRAQPPPMRGMYMPVRGAYMPVRGEGGVSSALTAMAMAPLPGAKAEGEALAGRLAGSVLLSGKGATKARLLAEGGTCDILHIATHGYADPDLPEFSGLLLAAPDDRHPYDVLTALEVYSWSLQARLVTLSACQTALGRDVQGEGVLGLTRAFIYAGAQDVVCSLWPVSDESTAKLMAQFYGALQTGATVEEALRQAEASVRQNPDTRAPFYWASFIAVRGPE